MTGNSGAKKANNGHRWARIGIAFALLGLSFGQAAAQSCSFVNAFIQGGGSLAQARQSFPDCFSGDNAQSARQQLQATSIRQALAISNAISNQGRLSSNPNFTAAVPGMTGLAAGGADARWSAWGDTGRSNFSYRGTTGTVLNTEGGVSSHVIGGDLRLSTTLTLGASAAFDQGGTKLVATAAVPSPYDTRGYTIAPYLAWKINNAWSLDSSVGIGKGELHGLGTTIDTDRYFGAVNANYAWWSGNWQIAAKGSLLHASEKYKEVQTTTGAIAGSAINNKLTQLRANVQAGYYMQGYMPYLGIGFISDVSHPDQTFSGASSYGNHAIPLMAGINLYLPKNNITGGIAYVDERGRSGATNRTLSANLNIRF